MRFVAAPAVKRLARFSTHALDSSQQLFRGYIAKSHIGEEAMPRQKRPNILLELADFASGIPPLVLRKWRGA